MNDEELGRLLSGAFDAQARDAVPDHAEPPPPRYTTEPVSHRAQRRGGHLWAPMAAAAAVVAFVAALLAFTHGSSPGRTDAGRSDGPAPVATGSTRSQAVGAPVHIKLLNSDGSTYGVGMPVIAYFSRKITDGRPLQAATTVTVDGRRAAGAWYFEPSAADRHYPYEAHLRLQNYWPAHASVRVDISTRGLSAGTGLRFDDSLTLDFRTGARHIATVNDTTHTLALTSDGKPDGTFPVSLGAKDTPTRSGVKVIMEKGASICMNGPGYDECGVKYTQRLTYDGEYLHAAPWNVANIDDGVDSSNGCTNLRPDDARTLFGRLRIGDVVTFADADGPAMQLGEGFGDWNVPWSRWQRGGLVPTR